MHVLLLEQLVVLYLPGDCLVQGATGVFISMTQNVFVYKFQECVALYERSGIQLIACYYAADGVGTHVNYTVTIVLDHFLNRYRRIGRRVHPPFSGISFFAASPLAFGLLCMLVQFLFGVCRTTENIHSGQQVLKLGIHGAHLLREQHGVQHPAPRR